MVATGLLVLLCISYYNNKREKIHSLYSRIPKQAITPQAFRGMDFEMEMTVWCQKLTHRSLLVCCMTKTAALTP